MTFKNFLVTEHFCSFDMRFGLFSYTLQNIFFWSIKLSVWKEHRIENIILFQLNSLKNIFIKFQSRLTGLMFQTKNTLLKWTSP